jgi:hypothetical protein
MILETLVYSPFNHVTWRIDYFIEFSRHESFKLYNTRGNLDKIWLMRYYQNSLSMKIYSTSSQPVAIATPLVMF